MTNQILTTFAAITLLVIASPSLAGPCDAYYSFDGTLADGSSNGYDGEMIMKGGEPATPAYADGKFGQALMLDGTAAMRALLDLNYDLCPQVTISAWIKLARDAPGDKNLHLLSTGGGASPGLIISGTGLHLLGTENGILKPNVIRKGSWLFVAGVYDYLTGEYALYSGGSTPVPGVLSPHRSDPQNAFWVGTVNDGWGIFAGGIAIDDLKITGRALSPDQIAVLRSTSPAPEDQLSTAAAESTPPESNLPTCNVQADCATGTYCAFDNSCHPDSHMPKQELELTFLEADPVIDASNIVLPEGARFETEIPFENLDTDYFLGKWCVKPSQNASTALKKIRSFRMDGGKILFIERHAAPGTYLKGLSWALRGGEFPALSILTGPSEATNIDPDIQLGVAMSPLYATSQRFYWRQPEGDSIFVRGACATSEEYSAASIEPEYFRGPWCITDSTLPDEPSKPNWRYLFHATGSMSRNPGDGRDYSWSWQQEHERLGLSDNGITTMRTMHSVTSNSFIWGLGQSRSYVRGACPTQAANSGPDLTAGPQPDGQGESSADEPVNPRIRPGPTGAATLTALSGVAGSIQDDVVLENGFMNHIRWWEQSDRPCKVSISGWQPADDADGFKFDGGDLTMGTNCTGMPSLSMTASTSLHVVELDKLNESAIGAVQVCTNSPPLGSLYHRAKGIRIWGNAINDDGSTTGLSKGASKELSHCHAWGSTVACGTGEFATGMRVHATSASGQRQQITGLQLICKAIAAPGDVQ